MSYTAVSVELDGDGVATVTLNRPEHLNAWNNEMARDLDAAMAWADQTDAVRVVVLTGAGRCFCAGADLSGGGDTFASDRTRALDDDAAARTPNRLPNQIRKPVIAAINGHAVGVGATYPMLCDVRFAAEDAKIAFVFNRRGMLPELGSHAILPRIVGLSNAADLLLSGRAVTGVEAAAMGLVSAAVPSGEVLGLAQDRARDIAVNVAPVSAAISKRLLWSGLGDSFDSMHERERAPFAWVGDHADAREGVESFLEKRRPIWSLSVASDFPDHLV